MTPPALTHRLSELAPRYGIRLALVFGSTRSGSVHERSDLDLGLLLDDPRLDLATFAELHHQLQAALPGHDLDLAILNHADPLFLHQVTSACELAYGSPQVLQSLRLRAFRRYHDHRRYLDMERSYVRRSIEELDTAR
jgi:predicted nucleotidyltransferase